MVLKAVFKFGAGYFKNSSDIFKNVGLESGVPLYCLPGPTQCYLWKRPCPARAAAAAHHQQSDDFIVMDEAGGTATSPLTDRSRLSQTPVSTRPSSEGNNFSPLPPLFDVT